MIHLHTIVVCPTRSSLLLLWLFYNTPIGNDPSRVDPNGHPPPLFLSSAPQGLSPHGTVQVVKARWARWARWFKCIPVSTRLDSTPPYSYSVTDPPSASPFPYPTIWDAAPFFNLQHSFSSLAPLICSGLRGFQDISSTVPSSGPQPSYCRSSHC
jgi:hypothetical protein